MRCKARSRVAAQDEQARVTPRVVSSADVLTALERALVPVGLLEGRPVLTGAPQLHARSTIYFVGDDARRRAGCLFVVKMPNEQSTQEDLPDPLGARAQFASQTRLARHFDTVSPTLRVPEPVALLPEIEAFAMEYVGGRDITGWITWRALLQPDGLLDAVRLAARFLAHLHSIDETSLVTVDLRAVAHESVEFAEEVMGRVGLAFPLPVTRALLNLPARSMRTVIARLHGDFAPVNVIVDGEGRAAGIDAALDSAGFRELDLARFLAMFGTERRFLVAQRSGAAGRLRRTAEDSFLDTYYGGAAASPLLEICRIDALARRWVRRQATRLRGRPMLSRRRASVVDAHFRALLLESAGRLGDLI
jgi:aminoglycoside phosphotransferase (APT) family kinase protein